MQRPHINCNDRTNRRPGQRQLRRLWPPARLTLGLRTAQILIALSALMLALSTFEAWRYL
jgi:hypothetical protein